MISSVLEMVRIREQPEDFLVEEVPLYPALGEGPHTHLWVEKRLRTTDDVARAIAISSMRSATSQPE